MDGQGFNAGQNGIGFAGGFRHRGSGRRGGLTGNGEGNQPDARPLPLLGMFPGAPAGRGGFPRFPPPPPPPPEYPMGYPRGPPGRPPRGPGRSRMGRMWGPRPAPRPWIHPDEHTWMREAAEAHYACTGEQWPVMRKRKQFSKERKKDSKEERKAAPKAKKKKIEVGGDRYAIDDIASCLNKPYSAKAFKNCLMYSQWLKEVPDDFEKDWLMVPCPPGKRMMIVAGKGQTRCFTKSGVFIYFFQSALPGGHVVAGDESSKSLTVLDCIWHHKNQCYYVLDVLQWNNTSLLHCDAEFRFYWLQQKFAENSVLSEKSENNDFPILLLPNYRCAKDYLADIVGSSPPVLKAFNVIVDGFLFYHLRASYASGDASAVTWLKPFMVPDVLAMSVNPELLVDCPENYEGVEKFIEEFDKSKKKVIKRERKLRRVKLGGEVVQKETETIDKTIEEVQQTADVQIVSIKRDVEEVDMEVDVVGN